jgi:hypothetical protein
MLKGLAEFVEHVRAYWKERGGYRPAAEDTHLDIAGEFHPNPNFIKPAPAFSPATLAAVADDLERMADEIEGAGLAVDRRFIEQLRAGHAPHKLYDIADKLWPHPVRPAYPKEVPEILRVHVEPRPLCDAFASAPSNRPCTGTVRNFESLRPRSLRRLRVQRDDGIECYYDVAELRTFDGAPVDFDAAVEAVKSVTAGPWATVAGGGG